MSLRGTETDAGTRFASPSPASAGEHPARGARISRLRKPLLAWSLISLFLGSAISGGMAQAIAHPPYLYTPPAPLVASPAVTVNPGVIFSLPAAHVNLTFANGLTANSNITLPGYGKSLTIDAVNLTFYKSPNTYPGFSLNFTTWNPAQTALGGAIAVISVVAPAGTTTLYLNLSGLAPSVFAVPLVDGAAQGGVITDSFGKAAFAFWDWSKLTRTIELDVGNVLGGPGGFRVLPSFSVTRFFDVFNATSDEWIAFQDTSSYGGAPSTSRIWKFGDGSSSLLLNPLHHFNFGLSGTFNVTLLACSGSVCNLTMQSVTLARWHVLLLGGGFLVIGAATVLAIWKNSPKARKAIKRAKAQVITSKRRLYP